MPARPPQVPSKAIEAAKASAWATARPILIAYFQSVCKNAASWQRASFLDLRPIAANSAKAMLAQLANVCPHVDPSDLMLSVVEAILPAYSQSSGDGTAGIDTTQSGKPFGAWEEWLQQAWMAAVWRLSAQSPCVQTDINRFKLLQPVRRNRFTCAVLRALEDSIPTLRAGYLDQVARTRQPLVIQGAEVQAGGMVPATSDVNRQVDPLESVLLCMKQKGWSRLDLAANAHVDHHTVNDDLNGRTRPYPSTLKKIADALGIAIEVLPKSIRRGASAQTKVPNSPEAS